MKNEKFKCKYPKTRPRITEPGLKILEPNPKYKNTRMDSVLLYRNTQKSDIFLSEPEQIYERPPPRHVASNPYEESLGILFDEKAQ